MVLCTQQYYQAFVKTKSYFAAKVQCKNRLYHKTKSEYLSMEDIQDKY